MTHKKLTDTQRVVLCNAAMQLDGAVLPPSRSIRLNSGAMSVVLKSLVTQGLILEQPASREEPQWRADEAGQRFKLIISDEGCAAIGVEPIGTEPVKESPVQSAATTSRPTEDDLLSSEHPAIRALKARAGTKLATLIEALGAPDGATIPQLIEVTGWQAHSIRGAMSGALKKKMGLDVASEKVEGRGRVYRLAGGIAQNTDLHSGHRSGNSENVSSNRLGDGSNRSDSINPPSTGVSA